MVSLHPVKVFETHCIQTISVFNPLFLSCHSPDLTVFYLIAQTALCTIYTQGEYVLHLEYQLYIIEFTEESFIFEKPDKMFTISKH